MSLMRGRALASPALPCTRPSLTAGPAVSLLLIVFGAVWLCELSLSSLSPPVDNIEQLVWMRSLEWGYYKHPPLPTWLIWLPATMFGIFPGTSYVAGALVTLGAMGLFWALLCRLRGATFATISLLAALCITYYNARLYYYNHDVVLLLLVVSCAASCAGALERRSLPLWACTGFLIGLGFLTKYQMAITLASVIGLWLTQRAWRDPVHIKGLSLALFIALLVVSPHFAWLTSHDFGPLRYAAETLATPDPSLISRAGSALHWDVDQLLNRAMPAWLLLLICATFPRRAGTAGVAAVPSRTAPPGLARALFVWWGLVPLVVIPIVGIVSGLTLQSHWGAPCLLFAVPAVMDVKPVVFWQKIRPPTPVIAFAALQAVMLVINYLTSPVGLPAMRDTHWRTYPSQRVAAAIAAPARARLGGPIRVVSGSVSLAGALMLDLPERPVVLLDGRFEISPWVSPDLVARCGAVELLELKNATADAVRLAAVPGLVWHLIPPRAGAAKCS